jgi:hypothetical protein
MVSEGIAYWYGGWRKLEDFQTDLDSNSATLPDGATGSWFQYLHNNQCRMGLHSTKHPDDNKVDIPKATYHLFDHLQNDPNVSNIGTQAHPKYRLDHTGYEHVKHQYTGIDCSGFCQRVSVEALFPDECPDLAGTRIGVELPVIKDKDGVATARMITGSFKDHSRTLTETSWRRQVAFRGDILNKAGDHIVMLETAERSKLAGDPPSAGDLWILQAWGGTRVTAEAAAVWQQAECVRRTVYSPLAVWFDGWESWKNDSTVIAVGRMYLWP